MAMTALMPATAIAQVAPASSGDVVMLQNLAKGLPVFVPLLRNIAIIIGVVFILSGIFRLAKSRYDAQGESPLKSGIVSLLLGGGLVSFDALIKATGATFFGGQSDQLLTYGSSSVGASNEYALGVIVFVYVIQLVGVYALIKSFILFRASSSDSRAFWPGVTHFIGAAFAINIVTLLQALGNALGGTFQSVVTHVLTL